MKKLILASIAAAILLVPTTMSANAAPYGGWIGLNNNPYNGFQNRIAVERQERLERRLAFERAERRHHMFERQFANHGGFNGCVR